MRILLDTHIWLWWNSEPEQLSTSVLEMISTLDNEVFLSAASVWEMAIKVRLGKLPLPEPVHEYVAKRMRWNRVQEVPILLAHAAAVENLPLLHRDPFDRLLLVQSRIEGMAFLTADDDILAYGDGILDARHLS